jgi:hypothetical protein
VEKIIAKWYVSMYYSRKIPNPNQGVKRTIMGKIKEGTQDTQMAEGKVGD